MKVTKLTLLDLNSGFLRKNPVASTTVRRPINQSTPDNSVQIADQSADSESSNLFLNAMTVLALVGVTILCYRAYKGYKEREEGKKTL